MKNLLDVGREMKWLRQLFCRHDYEKNGLRVTESENLRLIERLYVCKKCGKEIWIDARRDHVEKGA